MQMIVRLITLLIMAALFATSAAANCRVIDTLDKLQVVQARLAQNPDTSLRISDMQFLRRHVSTLSESMVLDAVDGSALSAQGASFLRFIRHLDELLNQVSVDDAQEIQRHFANPNVRFNLDSIRQRVTDLRCTAAEIAAADFPEEQEDQLQDLLQDAIVHLVSNKYLVLLLGIGIVVPICAYIFFLNRAKKGVRLVRHFTYYEASYRIDEQLENGTILNVNAKGAKLKHGSLGRLEAGGTLDILVMENWIPCRVSWSNHYYSGITFNQPLDKQQVQYIREPSSEAA